MSITQKLRYIPFPLGGAILALTLLFGVALFADKVFASPTDIGTTERLITIHDQGLEQTIVTKATTVRGA